MKFEAFLGKTITKLLKGINPFKKIFITTNCVVHKFINKQSILLLKKYNYNEQYKLYKKYLYYINKGSVWADQDFRSINHFYNPFKAKGLFGHSNSLDVTDNYYIKALKLWPYDKELSSFYLGAAIHIIQDITIPQHVNNRLLNYHRKYENFVKYTYDLVPDYIAKEPPLLLNSITEFIEYNAIKALQTELKYKDIKELKKFFYRVTLSTLPLAQRSTAGCFLMFFEDINL